MNPATRILIVDDSGSVRTVLRKFLADLGCRRVSEADDGAVALPLLQSGSFDLLITDLNMPVMDGLTLLRHLRANPRIAQIPALMVTAENSDESRIAAYAAGASGILTKPFTAAGFRAHLQAITAPQRLAS